MQLHMRNCDLVHATVSIYWYVYKVQHVRPVTVKSGRTAYARESSFIFNFFAACNSNKRISNNFVHSSVDSTRQYVIWKSCMNSKYNA